MVNDSWTVEMALRFPLTTLGGRSVAPPTFVSGFQKVGFTCSASTLSLTSIVNLLSFSFEWRRSARLRPASRLHVASLYTPSSTEQSFRLLREGPFFDEEAIA